METIVFILFIVAAIYVVCGFIFAIAFISKGIEKVDEGAHGGTWGFKLIIIPGVIALWPLLLEKWIKSKSHDETTA
ncbi:MAG: hypothetical protein ACM3H8_09625 [Sphingobacteriales bacterium]